MLVALAVVEERALARGVEHVLLGERAPLGLGGRLRQLEDLQRRARVAARALSRGARARRAAPRAERRGPALEDHDELLLRERRAAR